MEAIPCGIKRNACISWCVGVFIADFFPMSARILNGFNKRQGAIVNCEVEVISLHSRGRLEKELDFIYKACGFLNNAASKLGWKL